MARPKLDGMPYYPRDTKNSEDMEALISTYGNDAWACCERTYMNIYANCHKLGPEFNLSDEVRLNRLVEKCRVSVKKFLDVIQVAARMDIFDKEALQERNVLTSDRIKKTIAEVSKLREKARDRAHEAHLKKLGSSGGSSGSSAGDSAPLSAPQNGTKNYAKNGGKKKRNSFSKKEGSDEESLRAPRSEPPPLAPAPANFDGLPEATREQFLKLTGGKKL